MNKDKHVRMTVTIPQSLYQRYMVYKDRINVSRLLSQELEHEVDMIELIDDKFWSKR